MTELSRQQRAGITMRNRSRDAFLDTAETVFTDSDYRGIQVVHIANHARLGTPTFYTTFSSKAAWGAAVLDRRLNETIDEQAAVGTDSLRTPRDRALGHFGLLGAVASPLPGITQALIDERTAQVPYSELVPGYHSELTRALQDGQEQQAFRDDMDSAEMADFALDSIALAYAVHLDNPAVMAMSASLLRDGLLAKT